MFFNKKIILSKRFLLFLFFILIGFFLFYFIFHSIDWRESWKILKSFSLSRFLSFLGVAILTQYLHAKRHQIILKFYHQEIKRNQILGVRLAGFSLSYLIPSASFAGDPLRAELLKQSGIDSKIAYASVIMDKFWELASNFLLMMTFLTLGLFFKNIFGGIFFFIFIGALFYLTLFLIFYWRIKNQKGVFSFIFRFLKLSSIFKKNRLEEKLEEVERELAVFFKRRKKEFWQILFLSPLIYFAWLAEIGILTYFLGIKLNFFGMIFLQFILGFITLFPSFGGLGFLEASGTFGFVFLGLSGTQGLAFSILQRIKDLILTIIGILFWFYWKIKFKIKNPLLLKED